MGSVTCMEPPRERNTASGNDIEEAVLRPSRAAFSDGAPLRSRDVVPDDRTAVLVDIQSREPGHTITAPGTAGQTGVMRRRISSLAQLPRTQDDILQGLVSELFTNAVRHTRSGLPGGTVTVSLLRLWGRVQVRVTDQGPIDGGVGVPYVREQDLEREGGFGLRLVAVQADRWGTLVEDGRTTVWFELDHA